MLNWFWSNLWPSIWSMLVAFLISLFSTGCAAEKAIDGAVDIARTVTTAVMDKASFEQTAASANGRIHSPHYRGLVAYVQGVQFDIGVDGVEIDGSLSAQGSGEDKPLSDEARAAIIKTMTEDSEFYRLVEKAIDAMKAAAEKKASEEAPQPEATTP